MTTLEAIVYSALIIIATAIVAWIMKPIIDKQKELREKDTLDFTLPEVQSSHHIVIDAPEAEESEEDSQKQEENSVIDKADAIQERLIRDGQNSSKKRAYHKKSPKKDQASDTQNKPKRGRPRKTNKNTN